MQQLDKLRADVSKAEAHTAALEADVRGVNQDLQTISSDLLLSKRVNGALDELESALATAVDLLTVVSIIPEVGAEASTLKRTLAEFKAPVSAALSTSNRVERVIKPVREKIQALQTKVQDVDHALIHTMNAENKLLACSGRAASCIGALPDSTVKTNLTRELETAAATVDSFVVEFDKGQVAVLDSLESAKESATRSSAGPWAW